MRRHHPLILLMLASAWALAAAVGACGHAAIDRPSASAGPVGAHLPLVAAWESAAMRGALPGLLTYKSSARPPGWTVVIRPRGGSTSVKIWEPPSAMGGVYESDWDAGTQRALLAVAASATTEEEFSSANSVLLLDSDGSVRQVYGPLDAEGNVIMSPCLLADGSMLWLVDSGRYEAMCSVRGGPPRPLAIRGRLPAEFELAGVLPTPGRRTVLLWSYSGAGLGRTWVPATWTRDALEVSGKPYRDSRLRQVVPGHDEASFIATLVQRRADEPAQIVSVRWRAGVPVVDGQVSFPWPFSEHFNVPVRETIQAGPDRSILIYGWPKDRATHSRKPLRMLRLALDSGKVSRTGIRLYPQERGWQWVAP